MIITFIVYYLVRNKNVQLVILTTASFVFYAYHYPLLLSLLVFSITLNIIFSYLIVHGVEKSRKLYAYLGVSLNLSILAFFKYSPLIGTTFFPTNHNIADFLISIPLPIGISFFTFQGISLVVDTYRSSSIESYKSLVPRLMTTHAMQTALFISFFPQLVAGPIVKAHEFIPQIVTKKIKDIDWRFCFKALVVGYFLKMVIADNLKDFTIWITYPYFLGKGGISLIIFLFGYSMQIFADFAGYSLIAIGISALFGYRLIDNFNYPYISTSFSEFWRRWHISLSTFLREYLYIPLGGNRKGQFRTYFNLMMTMVLGGLWHGAAWSYAIWGIFHGLLLAIERLLKDYCPIHFTPFLRFLKGCFVFGMVTLAWLLFKLPEFTHVIAYIEEVIKNILVWNDMRRIISILIYSLPIILYHFYYLYREQQNESKVVKYLEPAALGLMLFFICTNSGTTTAFIYFQF